MRRQGNGLACDAPSTLAYLLDKHGSAFDRLAHDRCHEAGGALLQTRHLLALQCRAKGDDPNEGHVSSCRSSEPTRLEPDMGSLAGCTTALSSLPTDFTLMVRWRCRWPIVRT